MKVAVGLPSNVVTALVTFPEPRGREHCTTAIVLKCKL